MVPDRQKVRTDGRNGRTDGQTDGRCQNYIPPTSSGDKNYKLSNLVLLNPDVSCFKNTVDPNQMASDKAI